MEDFQKAIQEIKGIKKQEFNHFWLGFGIGITIPLLFIFIYWLYSYSFMEFLPSFIKYLMKGKVLAPVISLCVVPNLGVFYFFLNKEKYKTARGVIFSTLIFGFMILYLKIFIEETMF